MNPRVRTVTANNNFTLNLIFANQEQRLFDLKPYLGYPAFAALNNLDFFMLAKAEHGTVVWPNNLDFDPDRLFLESIPVK